MLSTTLLIKQLSADFPQFRFTESTCCSWSHDDNTIYYRLERDDNPEFILHELAHGLLEHTDYNRDIELLAMERDAWDKAAKLAVAYGLSISDQTMQSSLDTYRDWLHTRSICPNCKATGLQTRKQAYECVACNNTWLVNEARTCALRRYNSN